ncbi:hypothetical protein JR316_0008884 [Psilocybe cubensis]|uniref:Uncharacterized protein n=2 Tax=Psilocybe cubensis TaxID=181762 RepID=A0ACB8GTT2_PSICU|nr:hypothetical protein JR316_0008884 [Psilocybe cubensis]KAH9478429.1 hypothetical protein JR316_0008884 [Psilocybe cubensis]
MFSRTFALFVTALVAASAARAKPVVEADNVARGADAAPTVEVCVDVDGNCVNIPAVSDSCVNFTGGLSFLDKQASAATIPYGFVCTFYK